MSLNNDLVFVDNNYKLVGWLVGMDKETEEEYRKQYKCWTYGHFCKYLEGIENDNRQKNQRTAV